MRMAGDTSIFEEAIIANGGNVPEIMRQSFREFMHPIQLWKSLGHVTAGTEVVNVLDSTAQLDSINSDPTS